MHKLIAGLAAGVVVLVTAPGALAAPVTVDLRIEGPSSTLFEGPVTTDVRPFQFTGDSTSHTCNGTSGNGGSSATPVPTRGAAVAAAAQTARFTMHGDWFDSLGSPSFSEIAGQDVAFDPDTNQYLVEYKNATGASIGSCGDPIANGDRVLFAYGVGSEQLLALTGPSTARPGATATVKVTNASNGSPVSGATVGGHTTGADGTAVVGPFTQRGDQDFKATKAGTVRSNRLRVCVSDGSDGFCGAGTGGSPGVPGGPAPQDTVGPATTVNVKSGKVFKRRKAPRTLRGRVASDPSGLREVKLRLLRKTGRKCAFWSGGRERWRRTHLCWHGAVFSIGDRANWSYLLPKRLGRGRYVLEAYAIDGAGNRGPIKRVKFRVR